ncbi:MAG TPA: hypothetical protein ENJ56_07440, partial [Anaerolineae bacterium]|nr:hypothetical protein [Anaerolineae bacterium]
MSQMVYRSQPRNRKLWLATAMVAAFAVIILLLGLPLTASAGPNAAPVAASDNYATNEYLPLTVLTATGVLAN